MKCFGNKTREKKNNKLGTINKKSRSNIHARYTSLCRSGRWQWTSWSTIWSNSYGISTSYTQRMIYVIQRTPKAIITFFSMICHEYENQAGNHALMFWFLRQVWYEKAYFYANASVQEDEMIFTQGPVLKIWLVLRSFQYICMHEGRRYRAKIVGEQEVEGRTNLSFIISDGTITTTKSSQWIHQDWWLLKNNG